MNQIINLRRVEYIGDIPVSLTEAKKQLTITFTDDDAEITALILKAIRHLENYLNISIVYQRIELTAVFEEEWKLPYGPVVGIELVEDSTGATGSGPVTFTTSTREWKSDGDLYDPAGCYRQRITYTAGGACPDDLKDVILQVIVFLYENRGKTIDVEGLTKVMSNADRYKSLLWI